MSAPAVAAPVAAAPAAPKAKKVVKKATKAPASHPTYAAMVKAGITKLADRKGSSRAAILKFICANYKVGDNLVQINAHLRSALKRGASNGTLKQVKGVGAAGSFRLGEKKTVEKKSKKTGVKKPVAKKATTTASPKKKATKKATKPKSPKKAGAAKPKKAKSPKKAKAAGAAKPKKVKSPKKKAAPKAKKAAAPAPAASA